MPPISSKLIETVLFSDDITDALVSENDYGTAAKVFLRQQRKDWEQLINGYNSLKSVQLKTFEFDGFSIKVQYNPERFVSSSADVDAASISKRKCFLCIDNLLKGQRGFLYNNEYIILANPYPIFPEHYTIANINHFPQRIDDIFYVLLSLSQSMSKYYTIFYNGPKCGASAPDHLHFQAGNKNFMPIDQDITELKEKYGEILQEELGFLCTAVDDGIRRFLVFEGDMEEILIYVFGLFIEVYRSIQKTDDEPFVNILTSYEQDKGWRIVVFLREKHRPACYFETGDNKILLSPAAVDLGGVCITPREPDFAKITKELAAEILNEVSLNKDKFEQLKRELKENLLKF